MTDSQLLYHTHCENPDCGSSDANAVYDDGHTFCFSCSHWTPGDSQDSPKQPTSRNTNLNLIQSEKITRSIRGISPTTFQFWKYETGELKDGSKVHVANHFKKGQKVGQKIRTKDKDFKVFGNMEPLYGMWLWNKAQAKKIVITEGELDALSVSQAQGNKWPVVSIPNGAQGAVKSISKAIEYLESYQEIILMFDQDKPGQEAAEKVAQMFTPGKCKIASLPKKDANAMLVAGLSKEIVQAIWNAEEYRPDEIVTLSSVIEEVKKPVEWGIPWPWKSLTELTYGRRPTEEYYLGAGTGAGKTTAIAEIVHHDSMDLGITCGCIFLEQSPQETFKRIAGIIGEKKFHKPKEAGGWTQQELDAAIDKIPQDKIYLYDSRGSTDWDVLKQRIRYMVVGCKCKHIFIDNLTGITTDEGGREGLERIVREINSLNLELKTVIHVVSHLATPEGKSHEEGGKVLPKHFRGSRAIAFYANFIIGFERNQLADDKDERNIMTVRIGKDRNTGESTGQTFTLRYDHDSGRLHEVDTQLESSFDDDEDPF